MRKDFRLGSPRCRESRTATKEGRVGGKRGSDHKFGEKKNSLANYGRGGGSKDLSRGGPRGREGNLLETN